MKTQTKSIHTASPWKFVIRDYGLRIFTQDEKKQIALVIEPSGVSPTSEDSYANAYLIASAPEMLAKLKELIEFIEFHKLNTVLTFETKDLIKKAEGK